MSGVPSAAGTSMNSTGARPSDSTVAISSSFASSTFTSVPSMVWSATTGGVVTFEYVSM